MRSRFYKLWKMLSERKMRAHYKEHYKLELNYFEKYLDKKPVGIMNKEMKILQKFWGCYPFQYIRYGMYKKSCTLTIEEMKDYIPNYFAYYLFFPRFFKEYGIVGEDKELTYRTFESYGIAQPKLLLQYKHGLIYDRGKSIIEDAKADQLIKKSTADNLFLKPTLGLGGKGILIFNKKEQFVDKEGNVLTASLIRKCLEKGENYILQEGLNQHEEINQIYPKAVNTFRIQTKMFNGKVEILFAMLRMGQGGNQIDNASQHGLVCKVDVNTGKFAALGYTSLQRTLKAHPDTHFVFEGYTFPYWREIKEFITIATQKMETIGFIGWDVAYTVDGPVIIEMNVGPGLEYLQDCHGGVRKEFGIKKPFTYWYRKTYSLKDT